MKRTQELTEELIRLLSYDKQLGILDGLVRDGLITSYTVQSDSGEFLTMTRQEHKITDTMSEYSIRVRVTDQAPGTQ